MGTFQVTGQSVQDLPVGQQGVQHEQYLRAYREVIQLRQRVAQLERERTVSRYSE